MQAIKEDMCMKDFSSDEQKHRAGRCARASTSPPHYIPAIVSSVGVATVLRTIVGKMMDMASKAASKACTVHKEGCLQSC